MKHRWAAVLSVACTCLAAFPVEASSQAVQPPQSPPPASEPETKPETTQPPAAEPQSASPKSERAETFEAANCRFVIPSGWAKEPQVGGTLLLAFKKVFPPSKFMLACERIPPHPSDTAELDSLLSTTLIAKEGTPEYRTHQTLTFGGLSGQVCVIEAGKNTRLRYAVWTGRNGDRIYRMFLQRPTSVSDDKLISMLKDAGASFSLINPADKGNPAPTFLGAVVAEPRAGCSIDFGKLPGFIADRSFAGFYQGGMGFKYSTTACLAATTIELDEETDFDGAIAGYAGLMSASEKPTQTGEGSDGDIPWRAYSFPRSLEERLWPMRVKIGIQGKRLWFVTAWSTFDRPELVSVLDAAIAASSFTPSTATAEQTNVPSATLMNQLGVRAYSTDLPQALHWCTLALKRSPEPLYVRNAMMAAREAKMYAEGLEALAAYKGVIGKADKECYRLEGDLRAGVGDAEGAAAAWEKFFATGTRDDEVLDKCVTALSTAGLHTQALDLVDRFSSNKRRFEVKRIDLLIGAGREDEAITLLEPAATEKGFNTEKAFKYVRLLLGKDRARDAVEASKLLAEKNPKNQWAWFWKGRVEEDTDRLDLAKRSLQQAKELAPGDQAIAEALERVSSQLGEGDDGLVRTPIDPVPVEPVWTTIPEGAAGLPGDGGYRYDYWVTAVSHSPGKPVRRTTYDRSAILDRHGAEQMSSFAFSFNPAYERLYVNKCEVVSPDGKRREIDRSTFYVRTRRDASSERTLVVPVEGLTPGAAIEVVTTVETFRPSPVVPFGTHYFADTASVGRRVVVVYAPEGAVRFEPSGVTPVKGTGYVSFVRELCKPETSEAYGPLPEVRFPHVSFGAADRTWQQEAIEYLDAIKEPLAAAPAGPVAELAARLVTPQMSVRQKVEALTAHVQREVTYKAIVFGRHAQVPETCESTLTKRFGDCKAKSLLLHGLLTAAGVKSSLALISTQGEFVESIADRDQFNHMIVHVDELGEDGFIDPTADDAAPLISAPFGLSGRKALVLDREHARIATVRALLPQECSISVQRTVTHGPDKSTVEETATFNGAYAPYWRQALTTRDKTELLRLLASELEDAGADAHVDSFSSDGEKDAAAPLVLRLTYTVSRSGAAAPPLAWVARERDYAQLPTVQDRKSDFYIRNPQVIESVTRIRNTQASCPQQDSTAKAGSVHLDSRQDGSDTVLTLRLTRTPGTYAPAEYDQLRSIVNQAFAVYTQPTPASKP